MNQWTQLILTRRGPGKGSPTMTALGAGLYGGFFVMAALWLIATAESSDEISDRANVVDGKQRVLVDHR